MSDFKDMEHKYYLALADVKRLETQVDELEAENFDLKNVNAVWKAQSVYRFTDDQIDAAVRLITYEEHDLWGWNLLNKLNIYRCGGCGGVGHLLNLPHTTTRLCLDCSGHGWVIKCDES